jgi:hypothetical protein
MAKVEIAAKNPKEGTIGALVLNEMGAGKDYEATTKQVLKGFPASKWNKSHWNWYKNQIKNGRFAVSSKMQKLPKPKKNKKEEVKDPASSATA